MNARVFEERMTRSKSPKRYSLNRKTKEKERKQINSLESETQAPCLSTRIPEGDRCGNDLPCYERKRRDDSVANIQSNSQMPHAAKEKKNNWAVRAVAHVPGSTMVPCSPGGFHNITSHPHNNQGPRMKQNNQRFAPVPYANYPPYYANQLSNFQGVQTFHPQNALQSGVGRMAIPQGNPYVHSYMTPIQTVGGLQFSQFNMQGNEAYNVFTAYGNPFGVVWRQN